MKEIVKTMEEPTIELVTARNFDVAVRDEVDDRGPCTPSACSPNVACNPNTDCNPFNCAPAMRPCMPDCAPSSGCRPTGR